ncbi:2-oxyglutarate/Fe(II) oxygenase [Nitzschia inconspicua]|uniref:2-oxyglutarate/Fe(II) oxygenase n=1 Tax=Nitzschia inconspicua TaxID=303405 RepID=A0A9K3PBE8_9STRA|nr:2-oxyglutarate/Fe(II) oxygenase [Nitzschia inconspicua]
MTSPAVPSGMTSSPLAELKIADSHFLGFCAQVTDLQEAQDLQARIKGSYSNAAHVPLITTFGDWDEDGEPPSSIGPGMLQELQEFMNENDKPQFRLVVVIVRFFGERLLGVTCGRLEQCYRSVLHLTLHRFFFPNTAMERELHIKNHDNIYAMGAGDCELILNVVQDDKMELVQTLLTELQFDGFKGAAGEELPRLQNLQADLSQGVIPIYRYPGNYSGDEWMTYEWSPTSLQLKKAVEEKLQPLVHQTMNHCVTNYYRSGKDFIAHHGDKDLDLNRQGVIVSLSLGDERTLELRRRASPQDVYRVQLPHCSMLVLGPNTNRDWTHSILPKDASNEIRLSLTLREVKTFQDLSTGRLFGQGVGNRTLTQVRATEQLEKLALLSGFCALSGMILSPSTTRALSRNKSLLMMGTLAVSMFGLQHLSRLWKRKSDERSARDFFTKMSLTGTKY